LPNFSLKPAGRRASECPFSGVEVMDGDFSDNSSALDRRAFLISSALTATVAGKAPSAAAQTPDPIAQRKNDAYGMRIAAADRLQKSVWPKAAPNDDEARYPDKRGSFSKALPYNDLGEVEPAAYETFAETVRGAGILMPSPSRRRSTSEQQFRAVRRVPLQLSQTAICVGGLNSGYQS
jgi:hypothetical protein